MIIKYDTYQNMGQGGDVGSLMLTLEALKPLGITPDRVRLVQNDTKLCPDSGMSGASRTHFMSGKATIIAAEKLMNAMRKPDGSYRTYEEMVAEGIETKYYGTYETTTVPGLTRLDPNTGIGDPYACVHVLPEPCRGGGGHRHRQNVRVLRFTCVDDVGRVGNIHAVNGQAYSGIAHSIGFALSENYDDVVKACKL
jgi:aldehyde oxidoreductase